MTEQADRHGWINWDHYESIHDRRMRDFAGFVIEDNVVSIPTADEVIWSGRLICQDGFELSMRERQAVEIRHGRLYVRTIGYRYQGLRREGDATYRLFRYDNDHAHEGHPDAHHKHNCVDGQEIKPTVHVGEAGWPTLSDALEELRELWLRWQQRHT